MMRVRKYGNLPIFRNMPFSTIFLFWVFVWGSRFWRVFFFKRWVLSFHPRLDAEMNMEKHMKSNLPISDEVTRYFWVCRKKCLYLSFIMRVFVLIKSTP